MTVLELHDVSRVYPGGVEVRALDHVHLSIEQGELVAIIGPSGAGKSTLLNVLALLDALTSGTYLIGGKDTTGLRDSEAARLRCETFGFVFQSFHLLPTRSVLDNVMLGLAYHGVTPGQARARALEAIDFVGLSHRASFTVADLSGGERQRVAIARAVCAQAPVLLADEPTGNLDSTSTELIMDLLEDLNARGTTVVVVTHDADVAARARRRIHVVDGTVTEETSTADALDDARTGTALEAETDSTTETREPADHDTAGARLSHLRPSFLLQDVLQAITTDLGRTARLVSVVALAVMLSLTTLGLAQSARYQVADTFDAQRNRRVAVGTDDPALASSLAEAPQEEALGRLGAVPGVEATLAIYEYPVARTATSAGGAQDEVRLFALSGVGDLGTLVSTAPGGASLATIDEEPGLDGTLGDDEVLIGTQAAAQLGLGPVAGAPTVWIEGVPYAVAGTVTGVGLRSEVTTGIIMTVAGANRLASAQSASLEMRTVPGAARQVAEVAAIAWSPEHAQAMTTDAPPDPTTLRTQIESSVRATMLTLTGVAALAGLAVLANAMSTTVRQRTGELALRRAIGARRGHLRLLIGAEALLLGMIGGLLGALGSVLAVLAVTIAQHWQPIIDPLTLPIGLALGTLAGALSAVAASRQAGRIRPAQALR